ncbi:MAG: hypothetical protein J7L95_07400, partial [Prolixibacteraceae bacterium]|nr:hypothetical protein [Prolixibacteraceae bacterium]
FMDIFDLNVKISKFYPGFDLSVFEESFLEKCFAQRAAVWHCNSLDEYLLTFYNNKQEVDDLIEHLNNHYSLFFRNRLTFETLEKVVIPAFTIKKRAASHAEIRIWSGACASGQEIYSLAILLEELNLLNNNVVSRIFATDKCEDTLKHAGEGVYEADNLVNVTKKRVKRWFTLENNKYRVVNELKKNIDFSAFDLLDTGLLCPPATVFGNFDIIMIANVLFYYQPEFRKIILKKVKSNLAEGGVLVTGETEREIAMQNGFREIYPQSAIFELNK